ncbi:MAG TPA: DLW-39 family protein [Jatrophihabitans sp.]|nr:DLW-39 family protein [Jatrophihabitans sp.]
MKKLLMLAAAAVGVQYAMKRKKAQDSSEVWKQATTPQ